MTKFYFGVTKEEKFIKKFYLIYLNTISKCAQIEKLFNKNGFTVNKTILKFDRVVSKNTVLLNKYKKTLAKAKVT